MAGDSLFVYYKCNGAVMNARTIVTSARCCNIANGFSNIMGFLAPAITGYIINANQDLAHWRTVFFIGENYTCYSV